jgi:hypothetical protein
MWTRPARALVAALLTVLALGACGDDDSPGDQATDRSSDQETTGSPSDSPSPTVGSYPEFAPDDYSYTLLVTCFCPDAGVPVRVTVEDGQVVEAVYDARGAGFDRGEPAPDFRSLSINDVIDALNAATGAETVRVDWPEGQDYPSEVSIDESSRIADEEIGYTITDVVAG